MTSNIKKRNLNYLNEHSAIESIEGGLNLNEIKNIFFRRFPLIAGCTITMASIALLKVVMTPPEYVAGFELLSEPINIETKVTSSDKDSRETREEITEVELDQVQLKILKSPRILLRIVESLQDEYPDISYQELAAGLSIEIVASKNKEEKQNILQVVYRNSDKQKVADVVNALSKTYQEYSVEKRQSGVKRGIAFLDRQIPQISDRAKEAKKEISELRTQYNFNDPDSSLKLISARIDQVSQRREENAINLKELKLTLSNLERELELQPAESLTALQFATPRYQLLVSKKQELDVQIGQKSNVFSDRSEILQALKQDRQQLELLIAEAGADIYQKLVNKIAVLENRQLSLAEKAKNLNSQLEQWSGVSNDYKNLQHQLNVANERLNEFASQKDALQIDAAQQESPWQLLTPATEPGTTSDGTINYLLLGSTLGLLIGCGLAVLLDKQQKIIYTSAQVEEITNLPILASIPHSLKAKQLMASESSSFGRQTKRLLSSKDRLTNTNRLTIDFDPSIEAFRSFAANLGLLNSNTTSVIAGDFSDSLQSIVVTSAVPREGKSTVALNLAKASASIGKRVLLVDTDLRSTDRLTSNLGFETDAGLIDILNQDNSEFVLDNVKQLSPQGNLFMLTSGLGVNSTDSIDNSIPLDYSFLLASQKMYDLMEELKSAFDLVIYDLCSIVGFADVNLLAAKADGVVVVTGLGRIETVAFTEALNQLKLCNARVLGIAVNKVINKG